MLATTLAIAVVYAYILQSFLVLTSFWGVLRWTYSITRRRDLLARWVRVQKEDQVAALWRNLHERGFCEPRLQQGQGRHEKFHHGEGLATRQDAAAARALTGCEADDLKGGRNQGHMVDAVLHSVAHAPTDAMQAGSFLEVRYGDSSAAYVPA